MKLRARATLLGMLPALLLATILLLYLSAGRLGDLETTLRDRGLALARYLAESARYAVISGNIAAIQPLLEQAILEADVVHLAIYRPDGNPIVHFGQPPGDLAVPLRRVVMDTSRHIAFSVPVEIALFQVEDPFLPVSREKRREVAWVQVTMSRAGNAAITREMLTHSLIIVAAGTLLTLIVVQVLAMTGIRPLLEIIAAVRRIGEGDLSGRLPLNAKSELKTLQAGINQMSEALESSQRNMLARVESATAELALQKEAAVQANLAKSRFLAMASHDLRQPLHALGLYTASLKLQVSTPGQFSLVEKIEASVCAQEEMFSALLDLSRLEAGTLRPHIETFGVKNILDRLARDYADQARERGLRLVVRLSHLVVRSDPPLLARILSNLVSNAMNNTARGGVLVTTRRSGEDVRIQVWDTGIGIDQADLPHLFDEYFQVGGANRESKRGLGLGLHIVQRLCQLVDHRIEVRSIPGRGSVFSLTLPRGDVADLERRQAPNRNWTRFDQQRVLVIDDEQDARNALSGLLTDWDLNVLVAENANQAIARAAADWAPTLVISDYRLANGETGITGIAKLREKWGQSLQAILVSGDTSPDSVSSMAASGLTVLHKPLRPAKLRALLQSLLDAPSPRPPLSPR